MYPKQETPANAQFLQDVYATHEDDLLDEAALENELVAATTVLLSDEESQKQFPLLWRHFQFDPDALDEYRLLCEVIQAEQGNEFPLPSTMPVMPALGMVHPQQDNAWQRLLTDGVEALLTAADIILLRLQLPTQPTLAWAVKTTDEQTLILQQTYGAEMELGGWEVTVSAVATGAGLCHVDISLFSLDNFDATLENIEVLLALPQGMVQARSDQDGRVSFSDIPIEQLNALPIRIRTYTESSGVADQ